MPRKWANDSERSKAYGAARRAKLREQGLTSHGIPFKRHPVAATTAHLAKLQSQRAARVQNAADIADATRRAEQAHAADPRVQAYRAEKATRVFKLSPLMADAKREYDAQQVAAKDARKGGRPRRIVPIHRDPADALILALEGRR